MSTAVEVLTGHMSVARKYAANPDEWPLAPRFDPAKRWFHRLSDEHDPQGPEVWLLTWLPGQGTEWHDHGGSAGAFFIVAGELIEHTVTRERTFAVNTHVPGAGREFGPHHIHRLTNTGRRPAVSIHVYGPALKTMTGTGCKQMNCSSRASIRPVCNGDPRDRRDPRRRPDETHPHRPSASPGGR